MFKDILTYAKENDCSDIHLVAEKQPTVRKIGALIKLDLPALKQKEVYDLIMQLLSPQQLNYFDDGNDIDTAYTDEEGTRYRLNVYRQNQHYAIAMRLLRNDIPTIDQLHLPEMFKSLASLPRGLILVTGPTGSGKSTTLAAMIDHVNQNFAKHILTLEDPIEYVHTSKKSMVNQREIGRDSKSFQSALRSAMREDPDVILVGEMRDHETISLALTAAETGHLVFSTLHTTGAANTIDRIIDVFPPHQQAQIRTQLAGVLKAVISQALVPHIDNKKRLAAFEIMLMTDAIANLVRDNKVFQIETAIQTSARLGMQTLDSNLVKLIKEQHISKETAYEYCKNQDNINKLLSLNLY
ncbi:MAG: type IV pilus twitching motility protein PilT [Erysipelotrichaceae bacterium]|nr:type IV pilus twitching motility protein PilT [Erysipelotrichaceae bacterium]MDD3924265.1 type IV pilus twitching motility protein PilT [Erysipelotrichaceae bacterium]MDD4642888.1 type IV pilus twitching motility protein PilT [Erysipelotrichaceae bacterium]